MSSRLDAFKIKLDAKYCGAHWGKWRELAALDAEADKALVELSTKSTHFKKWGDSTPEEIVRFYFVSVAQWCDPKSRSFCLAEPLAPSKPDPALSYDERILKELRRWFSARLAGYVPVGLEDKQDSHLASWRRDVRDWFTKPREPAVNLNPEPAATDVERWAQYGRLLELDAAAAEKWRAECLGRNRTR